MTVHISRAAVSVPQRGQCTEYAPEGKASTVPHPLHPICSMSLPLVPAGSGAGTGVGVGAATGPDDAAAGAAGAAAVGVGVAAGGGVASWSSVSTRE